MHRVFHISPSGSSHGEGSRTASSPLVLPLASAPQHVADQHLGTSIGGLILPIVLPIPIERWGTAVALRGLSVALLLVLGPIMPFIRGRGPEVRAVVSRERGHSNQARPWTRDAALWILMFMNTLQSFAYYLPAIWLPSTSHASLFWLC
jgi:hypothetical protein